LAKTPDHRYGATTDLYRDLVAVRDHLSARGAQRPRVPAGNLPTVTTPLVGRDGDVATLRSLLLRDDVRWVTLTGPGGVGKTRLGLQVASEIAPAFHRAIFFVPLAAIDDAHLVPSAIAQALDVRPQGAESTFEALKRDLRSSHAPLLLLIDNFEHVADAAPLVTELLECSASLKVLITSRSVLHVYVEHEFPVSPLALPDRGQTRVEAFARSPAVALFVQRANAAHPGF